MFARLGDAPRSGLRPDQDRRRRDQRRYAGVLDYYLIGFVLAFIIQSRQPTGGESSVIRLSPGVGALLGTVIQGGNAEMDGGRKVLKLGGGISPSPADQVIAALSLVHGSTPSLPV